MSEEDHRQFARLLLQNQTLASTGVSVQEAHEHEHDPTGVRVPFLVGLESLSGSGSDGPPSLPAMAAPRGGAGAISSEGDSALYGWMAQVTSPRPAEVEVEGAGADDDGGGGFDFLPLSPRFGIASVSVEGEEPQTQAEQL